MKRKTGSILLSCVMGAALFSGCTITISPASPGTSPDTAVQSEPETEETPSSDNPTTPAPTTSQQVAQATATPVPQPTETPAESSVVLSMGDASGDGQEYTDLSFLTEEQQQLYTTACEMGYGLYGMGGNLMNLLSYRPVTDSEGFRVTVMENYELYDASYDTFSDQIHQIFTDNCLNATDYAIKFIDYDGNVAVDGWMTDEMVEGTTIQVNEAYPDTYRLVSSTEDEVTFTLISHYDRNGWNDIDDPMDVYTIEYPIRLVDTDSGWRVDEFHTTRFG